VIFEEIDRDRVRDAISELGCNVPVGLCVVFLAFKLNVLI